VKFFTVRVFFLFILQKRNPSFSAIPFSQWQAFSGWDNEMEEESGMFHTFVCSLISTARNNKQPFEKKKKLLVIVNEEKGGRWHATLCEKKCLNRTSPMEWFIARILWAIQMNEVTLTLELDWAIQTELSNPKWIEQYTFFNWDQQRISIGVNWIAYNYCLYWHCSLKYIKSRFVVYEK